MEKNIRNIEIGKFYFLHDGSHRGHPCLIVAKDDENNRYLVIRFDSDKFGVPTKRERGVKHITMLSTPTTKDVKNSYVHNRPMKCKRKDIGIELPNFRLNRKDKKLIEEISKRKEELGPSLRK